MANVLVWVEPWPAEIQLFRKLGDWRKLDRMQAFYSCRVWTLVRIDPKLARANRERFPWRFDAYWVDEDDLDDFRYLCGEAGLRSMVDYFNPAAMHRANPQPGNGRPRWLTLLTTPEAR